ncbi:hypothetical protein LTR53_003707 [Teratosphaeriaceae sp. CCFEE 6253]|nr:hypothetical protein LTR53_003707 [Teratosphaeriaceae sp. CCFEE 6253]
MPAATGNTAPALTSITVFFFCWALLTYALRLWVKLPKRNFWGIDDTIISAALVAAFANVCATCYAVNHGFGAAWASLSDRGTVEKVCVAGRIGSRISRLTMSV